MSHVQYVFQGVYIDSQVREYIEKKVTSVVRLMSGSPRAEVEIRADKKGKFSVEVIVQNASEKHIAKNTADSICGAVDVIEEELKAQIRREKERTSTLKIRGARSIKKKLVIDRNARMK
jgi:ribosomal subunit interface protein